jgi:hypothetical protein
MIGSLSDLTLAKIHTNIKPVFKSVVDANLTDSVRNVVTLGGDITITGLTSYEHKPEIG